MTKIDFPIRAPVRTYNFGDLERYFKYYMGSGLIDATIERRVQRELANRNQFPAKLFFSMIGLGIMIFLILMGAYIFMSNPSLGQATGQAAASTGGLIG